MSGLYRTIVVGTDGSASSFLAVDRAARIAVLCGARLIVGCAYLGDEDPEDRRNRGVPVLTPEDAQRTLRLAARRASEAGTRVVGTAAHPGEPVRALMRIVAEEEADLLVVGNRGINTLTGRLLGSVPSDVARQSDCDVMIVHTV